MVDATVNHSHYHYAVFNARVLALVFLLLSLFLISCIILFLIITICYYQIIIDIICYLFMVTINDYRHHVLIHTFICIFITITSFCYYLLLLLLSSFLCSTVY